MMSPDQIECLENEMYDAVRNWLEAKGWTDLGFFPPRESPPGEMASTQSVLIKFTGKKSE
jgi:hypothetical protein